MIQVFIADDHKMLLDGLRMVINGEDGLTLAGTASSGEEVLDFLAKKRVDVLLLDINLPGISGIDTCVEVRKAFPDVKVIGLSSYGKASIIKKMLKSGASGYVLKNAGTDEVLQAVRTVAAGEFYISKNANQSLMTSLAGSVKNREDFVPDLTRREKQVLLLISEEYTTPEIAEKLFISQNTVETHRKNLLHKFNAKNVAGLIRMAMERGLLD